MESDKQEGKRKLGLGLGFVDESVKKKKMEMTEPYEEEEDKVLYAELYSLDTHSRWFAIDPRGHGDGTHSAFGAAGTKGIIEIENMRPPAEYLDKVAFLSTAVLGSSIYFIGGVSMPISYPYIPLDDVAIYDTVHATWSKGPSLNVSRASPVAVIVIDTRIYVFGTLPLASLQVSNVDIDNWVECYDSTSGCWKTISGPKDVVDPKAFVSKSAFAVVHFRNEVRFVGKDGYFYVFDTDSDTWKTTCIFTGPDIPLLSFFNYNHVVCGDFAFWHWFGNVYAWNLTTNETSFVGLLEDWCGLLRPSPSRRKDEEPYSSNLVHLGNGFMCIVYWIFESDTCHISCYTFKLEGHPFSSTDKNGACHVSIGPATICSFVFNDPHSLRSVFALSARYSGFPPLET